jgi:ribose transport system substrate-binding protein
VLLSVIWSGCHRRKHPVYAVIPKGTAVIHWQTVHAGAAAAAREANVEVKYNGPAMEADFARQIAILDDFINLHVDGILLAPGDRKALVPAIRRAKVAGIPLTIVDSAADTGDYVSFVGTDNYAGGVLAARRMAEILRKKGRVAMTAGIPGGEATVAREKGFTDTLAKNYPEIKIVAWQYGMCDRARSLSVTEDILTANPGLNGIFASNESSSIGVVQAVKGRGLAGKVKIVGFDTSPTLVDDLRASTIDSLILQDPLQMGYQGLRTLLDYKSGRTPARQIEFPPVLATRDNMGQPEIRRLLSPEVKQYLKD